MSEAQQLADATNPLAAGARLGCDDQVENLLSVPSRLDVAPLKLDPMFASLRASPRFAKIVAGRK
ncbi:MAG: hypothetical protein ACRELE_09910 [Gemmatimonadales bacterium]